MRHAFVLAAASLAALLTGISTAFPAELKVGAFLPTTGALADVGAQIKAGMEVALDHFKAQRAQIQGEPLTVQVIWYDTEGKADVGFNAVTRALTVDKIHVGIGFQSSDVYVRVMEEFQRAKIPVVTCCSGSNRIGNVIAEKKLDYVFQLSPTVNDIAGATTAAAITNLKPKKVALLNENTDAGRDLSSVSKSWIAENAKDVEIVADEFVPRGTTDLTAQLAKLKRLGATAIIGEIFGSSAPVLYRQWFELKVPAVIAHMGASVSAQNFIDEHKQMMEGSIINNRWWPSKYTEMSEPMIEAYQKKVGVAPTNFAVQAHDAMVVAVESAKLAGSLDAAKVRDALENGTFVTAWGNRKFTPLNEGHRMPIQTVVIQVQNGKKVPIYPAAVAQSTASQFIQAPPYAWER